MGPHGPPGFAARPTAPPLWGLGALMGPTGLLMGPVGPHGTHCATPMRPTGPREARAGGRARKMSLTALPRRARHFSISPLGARGPTGPPMGLTDGRGSLEGADLSCAFRGSGLNPDQKKKSLIRWSIWGVRQSPSTYL